MNTLYTLYEKVCIENKFLRNKIIEQDAKIREFERKMCNKEKEIKINCVELCKITTL